MQIINQRSFLVLNTMHFCHKTTMSIDYGYFLIGELLYFWHKLTNGFFNSFFLSIGEFTSRFLSGWREHQWDEVLTRPKVIAKKGKK